MCGCPVLGGAANYNLYSAPHTHTHGVISICVRRWAGFIWVRGWVGGHAARRNELLQIWVIDRVGGRQKKTGTKRRCGAIVENLRIRSMLNDSMNRPRILGSPLFPYSSQHAAVTPLPRRHLQGVGGVSRPHLNPSYILVP